MAERKPTPEQRHYDNRLWLAANYACDMPDGDKGFPLSVAHKAIAFADAILNQMGPYPESPATPGPAATEPV